MSRQNFIRETCSRDPANYYLDILLQVRWCRKFETKNSIGLPLHTEDRDTDIYILITKLIHFQGSFLKAGLVGSL